jgi:hypothetical protein
LAKTSESLLAKKVVAHVDLVHKEFASVRFAEDRRWTESGLFYQLKQWLEYDDAQGRYTQIKQDKKRPRPMPVSNYFAKTINANANALGADLVRMTVTPTDDSAEAQRASEYTEMAKDAIDEETQMRIHNPLLAKHTVLWGMGVMKDCIDYGSEFEEVPDMEDEQTMMVGCYDCGSTTTVDTHDAMTMLPDDGSVRCPDCTSVNTTAYPLHQAVLQTVEQIGKGKIKSKVIPIFEVFIPRDCQNANLTPEVVHAYPHPLSQAKSDWPEHKDLFQPDAKSSSATMGYAELQTLVGRKNTDEDVVTIKEWWAKWNRLPERIQELIEAEYQEDPETLLSMAKYGVYAITDGSSLLEFGPNENVDPDDDQSFFPFTFFLWEVDPASAYPKGMAEDLKPLQKRLNRCDSLIERAMMANGAGKWLVPTTQQGKPPSGDPNDVYEYDVIGDGKFKPEFVQPSPFHPAVWQLRNTILQDFQELGLQPPIMSGNVEGHEAFRTMAYAGAKAAEMINTQRFLWETAHRLRYKKLFTLAKLAWDEPRKVKVAGHNGKLMYMTVDGEQMRGNYETDFVKDSSKPKTHEEKLQAFETAMSMMLINPADPANRQYAFDLFGLDGLVMSDKLQYDKAERDLEKCKRGELPKDSPYQRWEVFLKTFADFTLTELFEELDPAIQLMIIGQCEHYNQIMTQIAMEQQQAAIATAGAQAAAGAPPPKPGQPGAPGGGGKKTSPDQKALSGVPGQNISNTDVEFAAQNQGNSMAASMA